jgi:uncharacterized protein (DUF1330 family)
MKGYVLALIDVHDPQGYAAYEAGVAATIAAHGGRSIVRNGPRTHCEGELTANRLVVLEFESVAKAHAWYDSEEYQALVRIRQAYSTGSLTIIEGWEGA